MEINEQLNAREELDTFIEKRGWNKSKLIGYSECADFAEYFAHEKEKYQTAQLLMLEKLINEAQLKYDENGYGSEASLDIKLLRVLSRINSSLNSWRDAWLEQKELIRKLNRAIVVFLEVYDSKPDHVLRQALQKLREEAENANNDFDFNNG